LRKATNITLPEKNQGPLGDPLPEGTYTIGTAGNFATIQEAFNKLETDGVSGNVTLELIDELYVAPATQFGFLLNGPIPGAGPTSRVTIKPAENKNVVIEGNNLSVLCLFNTSYVTFDGVAISGPTTLTIHALQNSAYDFNDALDFLNNSDHNIIQNIIFIVEDYRRGSGSGFWFTQIGNGPDSNLIQNNFVKKAGLGLFLIASSTNYRGKGNIIRGNLIGSEIDSLISAGILVEFCDNSIIENNVIQNLKATNSSLPMYGIISYVGLDDIIRNNLLFNFRADSSALTTGICLSGDWGSNLFGDNSKIYNNMIYNISVSSPLLIGRLSGIMVGSTNNPKIYYNTIYLTGEGPNPYGSTCLQLSGSTNTNVDVKNNIFVNMRDESPYCASSIYITGSYQYLNYSDYNNLYYFPNQYNCFVRTASGFYYTLSQWNSTGKDLHSVTEMPNFKAPYLHIVENEPTLLESRGIPIAGIDKDFDGQTRHGTNPDIGADEFNGIVVGVEEEEILPTEYALLQNYPNPFNPTTVISYQLPVSIDVVLKVFDVLGNEVVTLVNEYKPAGRYEVEFEGSRLASGIYFYQLRAGEYTSVKKMLLIK